MHFKVKIDIFYWIVLYSASIKDHDYSDRFTLYLEKNINKLINIINQNNKIRKNKQRHTCTHYSQSARVTSNYAYHPRSVEKIRTPGISTLFFQPLHSKSSGGSPKTISPHPWLEWRIWSMDSNKFTRCRKITAVSILEDCRDKWRAMFDDFGLLVRSCWNSENVPGPRFRTNGILKW